MAVAKYFGDRWGVSLNFTYQGPAGSVLAQMLLPDYNISAYSSALSLAQTATPQSYTIQAISLWQLVFSGDIWVRAQARLLALAFPGVPRNQVLWDSGPLPEATYLGRPYGSAVGAYTQEVIYPSYPSPETIVSAIVSVVEANPDTTSVHVVTAAQDYYVDVASTTQAAAISGMSYTDWLLLYGYGIVS